MNRSVDRLTSLDRLILGASKRWPQDIGALAILDGTIGVGALSYAGAFNIGVVADRDAYPDLDAFMAGAQEELDTLGASAHLAALPGR